MKRISLNLKGVGGRYISALESSPLDGYCLFRWGHDAGGDEDDQVALGDLISGVLK